MRNITVTALGRVVAPAPFFMDRDGVLAISMGDSDVIDITVDWEQWIDPSLSDVLHSSTAWSATGITIDDQSVSTPKTTVDLSSATDGAVVTLNAYFSPSGLRKILKFKIYVPDDVVTGSDYAG